MSDLLPHLLRPFWLLIVPLPILLLWRLWHRQRQIGRWQRLLPEAFHSVLLTRGKLRSSRRPWLLLAICWLLACMALLGPSWQHAEQPGLSRADPLVVLLEVTPAMLAADVAPNRLEQAKRKLLDLLRARPDAQTAVVAFAGSAHTLVPLTNDMATTQNLLDALQPDLMPEAGHHAELAVAHGLQLLEHGANGRGRLLLIASTLSEEERTSIIAQLDESDTPLWILGIGTEQGAPITLEDGSFLKDASGAIVMPRLDEASLRRLASETGGSYRRVRIDDADLQGLGLLHAGGELVRQEGATRLQAWLDQGYWLLVPLLLLAALGGRRGWLFCLPLFIFMPQPAQALSLRDLWLNHDQQGMRLLEAEQPGEAAKRFDDPQWQAFAHYQAGDYSAAAELFAKGDTAADHYNRGNSLARSEALEAAIEAYEQALELEPELEAARRNKAIVEDALRQRRQQAQQAEQAQPKDDQSAQQAPQSAQAAPQSSTAAPTVDAQARETPTDGEPGADLQTQSTQPAEAQTAAQPTDAAAADEAAGQANAGAVNPEQAQALQQWLNQIPDNPGELLRRKFLLEQRKRQDTNR